MIKTKKTEAEKQLIKFRNQLHNLLIRNPEIRLSGDINGDVLAYIPASDWTTKTTKLYVPTSGKQEPIKELTANGVPVSL
jgi:hypothetical protein